MLRSLAEKWRITKPRLRTTGQILSLSGRVILGWVESHNAPSKKNLKVSVNGLKAKLDAASFTEVVGQPNRWQFEARLDRALLEGDIVKLQAGAASSELAGSPWVVRVKPKTDFEYAFLHVPKTAGTSLRMSLEAALGRKAVFPSQNYLAGRGGGYPSYLEYKEISYGLSDEVKMLQGHLQLPQIKALAPHARVIAVFREPVERVLSLIKHRLAAMGRQEVSENEVAERFLNRPDSGIANGQLGTLIGKSELKDADANAVDLAVDKLAGIDFLGMSDNYGALLMQLGEAIGTPLQNERLNTTKLPDRQFSEAFIDRVRELNQLDISLYKKIVVEVNARARV